MIRVLYLVNWVVGIAVILYGLKRGLSGHTPALLIAVSVIIVGPLEDILKKWVRRRVQAREEEPAVRVVDLATSAAFLILLLTAIYIMP
ncbi:MAG: hypothetical protein HY660_03140 [Armatimonadetes bacterium]|nr:hypothetical protein [Armatimonadota bacterium]